MSNKTYACLDVGESIIKLVKMNLVGEKLYISGTYKTKTKGVEDGVIYSKADFQTCVNDLLTRSAQDSRNDIRDLIIVLPSNKLEVCRQATEVAVEDPEHFISKIDVNNLSAKFRKDFEARRPDMEAFKVYPITFWIDKNPIGCTNPERYRGEILKLEGYLHSIPKDTDNSFKNAIRELGVNVLDTVVEPIANSKALFANLGHKFKAGILDIGGKHTTFSFILNDMVCEYIDSGIGTEFIQIELAKALDIDTYEAREIFERYGGAMKSESEDIVVYKTTGGREITEEEINQVVEAALNTILGKIARDAETPLNVLADSPIYITGSGANIKNINLKVNDYLNKECLIKKYYMTGSEHIYTTAIGGILDYLLRNKLVTADNI